MVAAAAAATSATAAAAAAAAAAHSGDSHPAHRREVGDAVPAHLGGVGLGRRRLAAPRFVFSRDEGRASETSMKVSRD